MLYTNRLPFTNMLKPATYPTVRFLSQQTVVQLNNPSKSHSRSTLNKSHMLATKSIDPGQLHHSTFIRMTVSTETSAQSVLQLIDNLPKLVRLSPGLTWHFSRLDTSTLYDSTTEFRPMIAIEDTRTLLYGPAVGKLAMAIFKVRALLRPWPSRSVFSILIFSIIERAGYTTNIPN